MKRFLFLAALGTFLVSLSSCSPSPIERAVKRDLLPSEANVIVSTHCQGCHVHSKLDADAHMLLVKQRFPEGNALREAKECLDCHQLKLENIFRKEARSTTRPHGKLIEMSDIPKPGSGASGKDSGETAAVQENSEEKEKKWYFFYLF
jgi:hypothetical protein